MRKFLWGTTAAVALAFLLSLGSIAQGQQPLIGSGLDVSNLAVTGTAAANTGFTVTLPAAPNSFHCMTSITIDRAATAALAGGALLQVTTTNIPGSLSWTVADTFGAAGTVHDLELELSHALKSSVAGTATTLVFPAPGAAVSWRANVTYYLC